MEEIGWGGLAIHDNLPIVYSDIVEEEYETDGAVIEQQDIDELKSSDEIISNDMTSNEKIAESLLQL
jgi:hypothetical protein